MTTTKQADAINPMQTRRDIEQDIHRAQMRPKRRTTLEALEQSTRARFVLQQQNAALLAALREIAEKSDETWAASTARAALAAAKKQS